MNDKQQVVIKGIDIPFTDMVWLLVTWAVATIPALIILGFLVGLIFLVLAGIGRGM